MKTNEVDINKWFNQGELRCGWEIKPDESMDKGEFYKAYFKNPDRWKAAFEFLKNFDSSKFEKSKHKLDGNNLFVSLDQYLSKDEENAKFEAHQKYADIQYVVSGEEKMGLAKLQNCKLKEPYKEEKDVAFYETDQKIFKPANSKVFFIFFPNDVHCPCVKVDQNKTVQKIVVKVRID